MDLSGERLLQEHRCPYKRVDLLRAEAECPSPTISSTGFGTKPACQSSTAGQVQGSPLCAVLGTFLGAAVEGREAAPLIWAQKAFVKEPAWGRGRALCSPVLL